LALYPTLIIFSKQDTISKVPLPVGDLDPPCNTYKVLVPTPNWHPDRCSHFWRADCRDQHTDHAR